MRISTSKSEAMVLDRKKVECLLRVKEEILPQVEEFKYLGVLFTSEGRMEREIDRRIGAASTVMRTLHRDRGRSSAILEELGVESLLLRVERSQMGDPGRPRTRWRDYVSRLAWERLGIPPDELEEVAGDREVWASLLRLRHPPRPDRISEEEATIVKNKSTPW
ncbi:hypothetical protein D4764_06G0013610 [Takifugu flavidus]|uniref:Reverse transcriptase domain-containing protein n=1 Tax=Takifugu flavidus TaxID=433684 RepID=A0A5C6N0N0_9TELE|nr:hypothetical protein D4764_06G0013610 [Takifugu flavidus]